MSRLLLKVLLISALAASIGCAYKGVIVKKEARALPFGESLGQDVLYKFDLRDDNQLIHAQLVTADVFDRYEIGDYFRDSDRDNPAPKKKGRVQKAVRRHLGKVLPRDHAALDRPIRSNPEIGVSSQLALLFWPLLRPDYRSLYLTPATPTPAFSLASDTSTAPAPSPAPPAKNTTLAAADPLPVPTPNKSASPLPKEPRTPFWKSIFRKKAPPAPTVSATPSVKTHRRRHSRRRSRHARRAHAAATATAAPTPAPSPVASVAATPTTPTSSVKNKFRLTTEAERTEASQKAAAEKARKSKGRRRLGEIPEARPEREGF